ncbi:vWA domain-containing protein [Janthinobacterium aquaticum]|uniref:vWA domain-containing protein n=1 Tax=Janthinobacterium sp. FT58W TaxID=2654254 RepID=UPI0012657DE5|nr:VWA domain-containing protein [Janthinobacterium sp. FT58W]KAB8044491.1 tellurium resistance protein [Janthinobacterium sp. FT58W]
MSLKKGQKLRLDSSATASELAVHCTVQAPFHIDISCFGLDAHDKLFDDAYMVFYNQRASPDGEIRLVDDVPASHFALSLARLPVQVSKLVFAAAIDPTHKQSMQQLQSLTLRVGEHVFSLTGADFSGEKVIMIAELYRKDGDWRLGLNGQGFNGGLDALLVHFGGEVASAATAAPEKISLEKRFEQKAPQLVSLAKLAGVSLAKHRLDQVRARAAFVIDASGSMHGQYTSGRVQEAVNRVFPLGVHFDDDEELETWAFAQKSKQLGNVTFDNVHDYVKREAGGWKKWMDELNAGYNNEPAVIRQVISHFTGLAVPKIVSKKTGLFSSKKELPDTFAPPVDMKTPVLVLFISDGGVSHNDEIELLIRWSSTLPIFWQFIGIGGSSYGALERLDDLAGRHIDNANFFALNDLREITEAQLYDRMMQEFPGWLKQARSRGMIGSGA